MPKIEMGKQYRTRDGRPVRIICTDLQGQYPVVGLIQGVTETVQCFPENGLYHDGNPTTSVDLIEVKPRIKRTVWLNIYSNESIGAEGVFVHHTEEYANRQAGIARIACIKIEIDCEEGEGLS